MVVKVVVPNTSLWLVYSHTFGHPPFVIHSHLLQLLLYIEDLSIYPLREFDILKLNILIQYAQYIYLTHAQEHDTNTQIKLGSQTNIIPYLIFTKKLPRTTKLPLDAPIIRFTKVRQVSIFSKECFSLKACETLLSEENISSVLKQLKIIQIEFFPVYLQVHNRLGSVLGYVSTKVRSFR